MSTDIRLINEKKCAWTCSGRAMEKLAEGDIAEAERCAIDLLKSIREIKRLEEKQNQKKQIHNFVVEMQKQGINIGRIVRP